MTRVRYGLWAVAIGLFLAAACTRSEPTPISPYVELLGLVPDAPETRSYVSINDYALIRKLFDIPLPGPGADKAAMEQYYNYRPSFDRTEGYPDLRGLGTTAFLSDGYTQWRVQLYEKYQGLHRQYLGFDIRNEDQTMVAGVPPKQLEVLRGRFDPHAFDRALKSCSGECTPPDAQAEYQGITSYSWGEDFQANLQKLLAPPAFDQLGRSGRIAVQDRYVFRTLGTNEMQSMIDASLHKRPSLADLEDYRLLARGMAELKAYGTFMTDQTQGFAETAEALCEESRSAQDCARLRAQLENQPMLRRYQTFATGVGKDEKGAYTALVLVHADAGAAEANVGLLRRRIEEGESLRTRGTWAQFFDANLMEVHARGRVLLAKLRSTAGRRPPWIEWVFFRDPLLLHK